MSIFQLPTILCGLIALAHSLGAATTSEKEELPPLYEGLGNYEMRIDTDSELAQKYFTQGLTFLYGYNYPEAARAFHAASKYDPNSGICCWAEAVALGECSNMPGDSWCVRAYQVTNRANQLAEKANPKERALILAAADRYTKRGSKYEVSDMKFVENMRLLHKKYPEDPDIAAIYSNSAMVRTDMLAGMVNGKPTGQTKHIVDAIEDGLKQHPKHLGLLHFYLHAMENCNTPLKALSAAERLDGLVPISGHLQHMPAHIYRHVGRYHDASAANQRGIDADAKLFALGGIQDPHFAGFYLHNHYYLFNSLMMEGRSQEALAASKKVIARIQANDLPSNPYLKNVFYSVPNLLIARFGMWDELANQTIPSDDYLFAQAAFHYAKGLSYIRKGQLAKAEQELKALVSAKEAYERTTEDAGYNTSLSRIAQMAYLDLDGAIVAAQGNYERQIEDLIFAQNVEDTMYLGMLPWYMPIRHALGAAYLKAGQPQKAERVYREDLLKHPKNGWALYGLKQSLQAQKRKREAMDRDKDLQTAWKNADMPLSSSRA